MRLKHCPFCGDKASKTVRRFRRSKGSLRHYRLSCAECGAMGPISLDEAGAREAWNRRVIIKLGR